MSLDNDCGIEIRHRFGIDFGIDCGLAYRSTGTWGHVYRFGFNWQLAIGEWQMAHGAWCMRQASGIKNFVAKRIRVGHARHAQCSVWKTHGKLKAHK